MGYFGPRYGRPAELHGFEKIAGMLGEEAALSLGVGWKDMPASNPMLCNMVCSRTIQVLASRKPAGRSSSHLFFQSRENSKADTISTHRTCALLELFTARVTVLLNCRGRSAWVCACPTHQLVYS